MSKVVKSQKVSNTNNTNNNTNNKVVKSQKNVKTVKTVKTDKPKVKKMESAFEDVLKLHTMHNTDHNDDMSNNTSSKITKKKYIVEPPEIDPNAEKIRPIIFQICETLEWMKQEIKQIKEDMETKVEMSSLNTLSLQVDNIDRAVSDLQD